MSEVDNIIDVDNPISDEAIGESEEIVEQAPEIPDVYRDKSVEDIIKMHQNAEQALSRAGNELGQNRKLVDKLLQSELAVPTKPEIDEPADWDYEPEKATADLVSKEVGGVKTKVDALERRIALKDFETKHGNLVELSNTVGEDFVKWVGESKYRSNLFLKGMHNKELDQIDLDISDELLSAWEENKPVIDPEKRKNDLKAASLERSASGGGSRKKTWSRAYIRDLRLNDETAYLKHKDEITAAYREGRITK